jgi:CHAT domain-containing protein/Tfp pilus assembly protein PilF
LVVFCLNVGRSAAQDDNMANRLLLEQALPCQKQAIELREAGKYAEAIPLAQKAVGICEQTLGEENRATASCVGLLASIYEDMGNYAAAEPLYKRSLAIFEKTLFAEDPTIGTSLRDLAWLYRVMRNYAAAEPLFKRSLAIFEKAYGTEHPSVVTSLDGLALLYVEMGNYAAAETLHKRSLAINEKVLGPNHPNTATSLNNLAVLYCAMGNYAAAEPLHKRSLAINETALGREHLFVAKSLNNLAALYYETGNYAAAEPLYKQSLAINEKLQGPDHPDTAQSLNNLALFYRVMGNYAAAEPLYKQSLRIREKVLVPDHPDTALNLDTLALVLAMKGQPTEALMPMQEAWRIQQKQRAQFFSFATEREQIAFANSHAGVFCGDLSLTVEHLAANPAARRFAFSVVLASKSATLEALSQRQADVLGNAAPELKPLFAEWQNVVAQLSKAIMATPKPGQLDNHLARIVELESRKETAEQALAQASHRFASERHAVRVAPGEVARALASGSALVEFAKYRSFRFSAKGKEEKWGDWNYVALVLRGGGKNAEPEVALVRLGSANKIEAAVRKWRKASAPDEQGRRSDKAALDAASQELAALVWNPIVPALADCRKLYLSPDGELTFVSFGALPGSKPDSFVIDDYDITYVATGRDLVRQGGSQDSASLLVGAPDFGEQQGAPAKHAKDAKGEDELLAMRPGISDLRSFSALNFAPLPGTRSEVENVARLLQQRDALRRSETVATVPVLLTGAKADEAIVKAAKHPGILHLATHGFFLPDSGLNDAMSGNDRFQSQLSGEMREAAAGKLWRQMKLKNPMHRSGIALAGANDTIRGRREAGGNDGILTAEEVAGMDLWGTKMVVISACESGLGEAKGGEGVFGLRRAFTMAGAQSLVMTLWAVSDEATRQLMESLYRHLPEQRTPQRALLAAQREWIARKRAAGLYPHPVHWAGFVASGIGLSLEKGKIP